MENVPMLFIVALLYLVFLYRMCRFVWNSSAAPFAFSILDIWAFILGITPAMILLSFGIQHNSAQFILLAALMLLGNVAGFLMGVMGKTEEDSRLGGAIGVLVGTLSGILLAASFLVLLWICIIGVLLTIAGVVLTYGLGLIPLVLIAMAIYESKKPGGRQKPKQNDVAEPDETQN